MVENNKKLEKIEKIIQELEILLNKEYLESLNKEEQQSLYNFLMELCLPIFEYCPSLRSKELRKAFFARKLWGAWKAKQNGSNNNN